MQTKSKYYKHYGKSIYGVQEGNTCIQEGRIEEEGLNCVLKDMGASGDCRGWYPYDLLELGWMGIPGVLRAGIGLWEQTSRGNRNVRRL